MTFSDETLAAYVDRALDPESAGALEAAAARDPVLAQRIERQRALRDAVHAAYQPVLEEPMPRRLLELAHGAPPEPAPQRGSRSRFPWAAIAASLALGVLIGAALLRELAPGADFVSREGRLVAGGRLAVALSQQLAGDPPADAPLRIGLTFLSRDGKYCRTFARLGGAQAGLACNDAGTWRLEVIAVHAAETGEYRTAGASLPQAVLRAVEERMQGATLDAAAERAARDRGWSRR